jgi:hypothetical protein
MGLLGVLGLLGPQAGDSSAKTGGSGDKAAALATWRSVRLDVIATLRALAKEAEAEKDPESAKAVLETHAVIGNLTADPATAQQVHELKQWLANDDVVNDVCAIDRDIRKPLLAALASVEAAL